MLGLGSTPKAKTISYRWPFRLEGIPAATPIAAFFSTWAEMLLELKLAIREAESVCFGFCTGADLLASAILL